MANNSQNTAVLVEWRNFENSYQMLQTRIQAFTTEATVIGASMIQDVPTRIEYMKMIRAEADDMLAYARKDKNAVRLLFDRIYKRRNEMRMIQQAKTTVTTNILSKLMTKNPSKYQLLVRAANTLAKKGKIPSISVGKDLKSIPLEELSSEQLDEVFLKAIDKAGGSRKSITPMKMKLRGAGLLLLTVAMAGLDIYLAKDKSFAVSKNASSIAGGAGGAWFFAAGGLAVGGPIGGLIGLIVGGVVGSYAAEEAHFQVRGLNVNKKIDSLVNKHHGLFNFDEKALGRDTHKEFLAYLQPVYHLFFHLNEKRNTDADDVAFSYIEVAQTVCREFPNGALVSSLRTPVGQELLNLLYLIQDGGWTTSEEYTQMNWLNSMRISRGQRT